MGERIAGHGIAGRSILIVEDETIVAMLIEDLLEDLGCEVAGIASRLDEAVEKVSALPFDAAILDVNLNGHQTYPLAELLREKGCPFVLATGYGTATLPEGMDGVPVISKPFDLHDLERALTSALAMRSTQYRLAHR
jgi:CheY-like chemotaxis protein